MRVLVSLLAVVVMFIPTWLFLLLRNALHPEGFWQNFATGVVGISALGGLQLFLLFLGIWFLIVMWKN